jgi:cytosolic carboxypeptidase protein 2/3
LAGNKCDFLTITSKDKDPKSAKALAKKGVFISARVHPGESNASWMMKGVIEYLVSNTPEAKALRDHFVFKIVPILNPDGVINGNYRCSLAGQDLNRRWKAPSKILHPVNSAVKKLIRSFVKEREIVLYCDLHGHSRRKNIFMYGNNIKEQPHSTRVFPYIMSKLCDYFSFEQSRFSMSRTKDGTARVAMFKELNIPNIFTMEASFCGADKGKFKDQHFTTEYLMMAG